MNTHRLVHGLSFSLNFFVDLLDIILLAFFLLFFFRIVFLFFICFSLHIYGLLAYSNDVIIISSIILLLLLLLLLYLIRRYINSQNTTCIILSISLWARVHHVHFRNRQLFCVCTHESCKRTWVYVCVQWPPTVCRCN